MYRYRYDEPSEPTKEGAFHTCTGNIRDSIRLSFKFNSQQGPPLSEPSCTRNGKQKYDPPVLHAVLIFLAIILLLRILCNYITVPFHIVRYADCKIHRDLKVALYREMISLFDKERGTALPYLTILILPFPTQGILSTYFSFVSFYRRYRIFTSAFKNRKLFKSHNTL